MRTIAVRNLSGAEISKAADQRETLGLTNDGVLSGVLIPVDQTWIHNLVEWNMSRIIRAVEQGEKTLANGEALPTLEEVQRQPKDPLVELQNVRNVSIRDFRASMIAEAAQKRETLWITNAKALCGILIPVTPNLIQRLVNENFSRILFNVERGEKEIENSELLPTVEEMLRPNKPN